MKKNTRNTKGKIVSTAWRLFYEQGYDNTTVEDIVLVSETSKGSFYHYFDSKDALLTSLADLFDEKYEQLMETVDRDMNSIELLKFLNESLFRMIEDTVPIELLSRLLSSQVAARGEKSLLDRNRTYFKLLRQIIGEGQKKGEITGSHSVKELVKIYTMQERALMYDWCLADGEYSLHEYAREIMGIFLDYFDTRNAR